MASFLRLLSILSLLSLGMYFDSTMLLVFGGVVLGASLNNFGTVIERKL